MTSWSLGVMMALALGQSAAEPEVKAEASERSTASSRHSVGVSAGPVLWPALRDLERFRDSELGEVGVGVTARYRLRALTTGPVDLLVGASWYGQASLGQESNDTLSKTWALTGDLVVMRSTGPLRPYLAGGLGYYEETIEDPGKVFSDSAFGGWAGAGLDFRFGSGDLVSGLFLEARVDFTDFGTPTGLAGEVGRLDGPIYTLQLGGQFGSGP